MDAILMVSFLGHSSGFPALDDFLHENTISKRPKRNEGSEEIIDKRLDLSLSFRATDIFDEESLIPRKSDGWFILDEVTFGPRFATPLPYDLNLKMERSEVDTRLGLPVKERPNLPLATYVREGLLIIINWNHDEPAEGFIRFKLSDIYDKKNLNL